MLDGAADAAGDGDNWFHRPSNNGRAPPKGFGSIPYLHNGQPHEYVPDFIIRLAGEPDRYLVLETKGFDELADIKAQAADRWMKAVNADGRFGTWRYAMARKPGDVTAILSQNEQ